jgi:hypothetical protein
MKLGELRAAIRKSKAAPAIQASIGGSPAMLLLLQKGSILNALELAFPGGKAVETGLEFDDSSGLISGPPILEAIGAAAATPTIVKFGDSRDFALSSAPTIIDLESPSKSPTALVLDI